jgi:hypothetical protein
MKAAIAAGLSLTAKGKSMIQHSFSEERTKEEIEKGTNREDDNKPWIWQHQDAASKKYTYVNAPKEEPAPATTLDTPAPQIDTPAPVTDAPVTDAPATDTPVTDTPVTEGQRGFVGWVRGILGL